MEKLNSNKKKMLIPWPGLQWHRDLWVEDIQMAESYWQCAEKGTETMVYELQKNKNKGVYKSLKQH